MTGASPVSVSTVPQVFNAPALMGTLPAMKLHHAWTLLLGMCVLAACDDNQAATGGTADERIRSLAQSVGAGSVGAASIGPDGSEIQFLTFDGTPGFASTDAVGQIAIKDYPNVAEVAFLTRPVMVEQLQLETFAARLEAVTGCQDVQGSVYATYGGSILQEVGCAPVEQDRYPEIHATYLDAKRIEPLTTWDEASLATALEEARQLVGDQAAMLDFRTNGVDSVVYWVMSPQVAGPYLGWPCNHSAVRTGSTIAGARQVLYVGCMPFGSDGATAFPLQQLTAAALRSAVASGAEALGIPVERVQQFEVVTEGTAPLSLRVSTDLDAEVPRRVLIPLG